MEEIYEILAKENELNKGDLWQLLEQVTYKAIYKEITLDEAEKVTRLIFKKS